MSPYNSNVDQARAVIVIRRSLRHGYAGVDNELYVDLQTEMLSTG